VIAAILSDLGTTPATPTSETTFDTTLLLPQFPSLNRSKSYYIRPNSL